MSEDLRGRRGGDNLGSITWGLIVVLAGVVFLLSALGEDQVGFLLLIDRNEWAIIGLGAGLILLVEVIIRLVMPDYGRPRRGRIVLSLILIILGMAGLTGVRSVWPLVLMAIGLIILANALIRPGRARRHTGGGA